MAKKPTKRTKKPKDPLVLIDNKLGDLYNALDELSDIVIAALHPAAQEPIKW